MKNKMIYIFITLASILMNSCDDEYDPNSTFKPSLTAHYLRPSKTSFGYEYWYRGFSETFEVESSTTSWEFTETPDWVSLTPNRSNKTENVNISANDNPFAENRTAIFYLSSAEDNWEYSRAMSVSQGKAEPVLYVDQNSLTFGGGVETQNIRVNSNCKWSVSNSTTWISTESNTENGSLAISVAPNPGTSYRTGYVYIKYENSSLTITIKQAPSGITSTQSTLNYENVASAYELSIDAEADWTASSSDSWINVSPSSGVKGQSKVTIEVSPNTTIENRTGYVTFYTDNNSKLQIKINQRGLYIQGDKEILLDDTGKSVNLNITSNTDWEIFQLPNWINVSTKNGTGNSTISVGASENPSSFSRKGEIVFGQKGLELEFIVVVTQGGKYLNPQTSLLNFSDKAGSLPLKISSNAEWRTSFSDSWFNLNPTRGIGDCDIEVSVTENNSLTERAGTIQFNYADNSTYVNIHQIAKFLTIDEKIFDFTSTGGVHTIDICTNDRWVAEIEHQVSWLKLSSTSGDGDTQLKITAEDNPSINVRSTTLLIKSENAQDVRILISQQPRVLTINTQRVLFFAKGGMSEVITINTDGKYSIKSDAGWFTINQTSDKTFTIFAAENKNSEFRKASITISLTDLVGCSYSIELPVVQAGIGGSFILEGFTKEENWGAIKSGGLTISISSYQTDKNWGSLYSGGLKVVVNGYTTDNDWNLKDESSCRATIINYGDDQKWDENNKSPGQVGGSGYDKDKNWNNYDNSNGQISGTDYNNDIDWNNE